MNKHRKMELASIFPSFHAEKYKEIEETFGKEKVIICKSDR